MGSTRPWTLQDTEFTAAPVETVPGHRNYQIVAELLSPAKEVDVTLVEEVVGAVADDFGHIR